MSMTDFENKQLKLLERIAVAVEAIQKDAAFGCAIADAVRQAGKPPQPKTTPPVSGGPPLPDDWDEVRSKMPAAAKRSLGIS